MSDITILDSGGTPARFNVPKKVVIAHDISAVMGGGVVLEVHPRGRVLTGQPEYGPRFRGSSRVLLYVEEPMEPAPPMKIKVAGFRDGSPIPEAANYVCSIFEPNGDHAHIYVIAVSA
jgi:hypothetical protein